MGILNASCTHTRNIVKTKYRDMTFLSKPVNRDTLRSYFVDERLHDRINAVRLVWVCVCVVESLKYFSSINPNN